MPRLYAWVMTVATVPSITLLLFVLGLVRSARELPFLPSARTAGISRLAELRRSYVTRSLWLLCLLLSYAPWLSTATPT